MPIISVEIMKKIGEKETQKTKQNKTKLKKTKKKQRERTRGTQTIAKGINGFVEHLSFLQLICKLL